MHAKDHILSDCLISLSVVSDSLQPHELYSLLSISSVRGHSSSKNTGVGCHALLQGIFPTQGSNPGLPYCRQILYSLSHQGSPSLYDYLYVKLLRQN